MQKMPKILIVKTTSLGDLIHSMPAVTDVQRMLPGAEMHWLVEEDFVGVPVWHPFIKKVHACATRRWRKSFFSQKTQQEIKALKNQLLSEQFDLVIDAQGLVKSALMVRWLDCVRHGYDSQSIKEKLASRVYTDKHNISRDQGAIERVRQLVSESLGYSTDGLNQHFGLQVKKPVSLDVDLDANYAVFLHGTNWDSKIWPVDYWRKLAEDLTAQGIKVFIPWGNKSEHERALTIAKDTKATVLQQQPLDVLAYILQNATVVVGSDTGLTHISAALGTKTIGIYGSTSTQLTGLNGDNVKSIQSDKDCSPCLKRDCPLINEGEMIPCYQSVNPATILKEVQGQLSKL